MKTQVRFKQDPGVAHEFLLGWISDHIICVPNEVAEQGGPGGVYTSAPGANLQHVHCTHRPHRVQQRAPSVLLHQGIQ